MKPQMVREGHLLVQNFARNIAYLVYYIITFSLWNNNSRMKASIFQQGFQRRGNW